MKYANIVLILFIILLVTCVNNKVNTDESVNPIDEPSNETKNQSEEIKIISNAKKEELSLELGEAAADGDLQKVKDYLKEGADINYREPIFWTTALYLAIKFNNKEIIKYLIDNGADVNLRANEMETPLMTAILFSDFEIVKYLIGKGADVNSRDKDNWTALLFAVYKGDVDTVKLLINQGADVNVEFLYLEHSEVPREEGVIKTILQAAKEEKNQEIIDILVKAGAVN